MNFPLQNIPSKKKDEEWHKNNVLAILHEGTSSSVFADSKQKDHDNYQIAAGKFNPKHYAYVTDTYGTTSPARFVNYPMIMPKLDLLVGELVSQPLQYTVNVINRNALRKKNEDKITLASEVLLRPIRREIEKALGIPMPDENVGQEVPPNIERYSKLKFRNAVEEQVHVGLAYCIQKWKLKSTFKQGFYDMGITGKEFYRTYIKNGDPYTERLDPRSMLYPTNTTKESLCEAKYAGTDGWMTLNEVIDRFTLTKVQIDKLEKIQSKETSIDAVHSKFYDNIDGGELKIRVVDVQWRSIRMLKHKVSPNPWDENNPHYKKLKDNYKTKKGEKVISKPITEIRQATLLGHEILVDWGAKPNQLRYEENYSNTVMDFHGALRNDFNGGTLSVVDSLKNIQSLINIVMYQIELAMSRSGGKAMVYDVSQKPKNIPLEDVFYHAKNTGLILINNKAEGYQTNSFNQFQQVDFTLSQSVAQMVNLKIMLEETADKLTGISAARSGVQKSGDLVGVTERNVMQSTLITAPLFDLHYRIVGDVFNSMAGLMRIAWAKEGRMANVFGDTGMQTFKIDKSISLSEYGIFVENSGKEVQRKRELMGLIEKYASTGSFDPKSAIKAVNAESSSEVESILVDGLEAVEAVTNQLKEREIAVNEARNEIDSQKIQVPLEVAKLKSETDLKIAQMKEQGSGARQGVDLEHQENMQQEERIAGLDSMMLQDEGNNAPPSNGGNEN